MGKKYEPVPDTKRQQLIYLIYEKGMNISKASKEAGIYYPTAKAINKIYLRQGRACKKTNRDRSKKNQHITIKVQEVETELLQNSPMTRTQSDTSTKQSTGLLIPNFVTNVMQSTACSATENDFSHNMSNMKEDEIEVHAQKEHDITNHESSHQYAQPDFYTTICPFHTPDGQAQFANIMKFIARIKASSCTSCDYKVSTTEQHIQHEQNHQTLQVMNSRRQNFEKQCTATFGEEEKVQDSMSDETRDMTEDFKPVFHFHQYSKYSIQRPVPVVGSSEEENEKMEELMDDPVVKYYESLPMTSQKVEQAEQDD